MYLKLVKRIVRSITHITPFMQQVKQNIQIVTNNFRSDETKNTNVIENG